MIKAIIFDLGGVLFINGTKKFIMSLSKKYNIDLEKARDVIDGGVGTLYRENKISRDEFWERALKELLIEEDSDRLETEWINGYDLIEETKELILELKKKYKIYYVSDNAKGLSSKLNEKYDFRSWFDDGILAYEAGVRKPHPLIYEMLMHKAKLSPNEAIYIDDKKDNLFPSKEMGMQTILFESPEKLKEKLIKLRIF